MNKYLAVAALGLVSFAQASKVYKIDAIYPASDPTCSQAPTYVEAILFQDVYCESEEWLATGACRPLEKGGYIKRTCTAGDPVSFMKMNPNEVTIADQYDPGNVDCSNEPGIRRISKIGTCSNHFDFGWVTSSCDGALQICDDDACTAQCAPFVPGLNGKNGQCVSLTDQYEPSVSWSRKFTCPASSSPAANQTVAIEIENGGTSGLNGGLKISSNAVGTGGASPAGSSPSKSGASGSHIAVSGLLGIAAANALMLL